MLTRSLVFAAVFGAVAATPVNLDERQTKCEDVHFFIARGSVEPYPGRQVDLVTRVCEGLSSCGYEDIIYPATYENYCDSAFAGVTNGTAQITAYAKSCPESKLVLTGYSQGGHVVGDILGGGGGSFQGCTQKINTPLSPETSPGNKIVAATFFGDVRHTASQSYNLGTGAGGNGVSTYTVDEQRIKLLHSWCFADDPVCGGGKGMDYNWHTAYFNATTPEAAAWVKTKL
ncbi:carbohydrate esterase family 5 protein [Daldinia caldariorum]|uniref:carbohydrate esterase family 5 protein n=1 Tax=Daldinia caldariorum TaxID=326644 RepID=UPI002007A94D|nr:carbohydrate esterase family 5 protein [Daldinia caldariorum]KAI1472885.1 carbohydrate esterase family 5 protein [Daldinia caldariorum]